MIVPSIDLMTGDAVQLIGGEQPALNAGDPRPLAQSLGIAGEIAVIDLDAARSTGSNAGLVRELLELADCRVGGGIRSYESAAAWLDAGASRVIVGTAAREGWLRRIPRERLVIALDARDGEVVVEGWRTRTGLGVDDLLRDLRGTAGGFLVTFVEREGRMEGTRMDLVAGLVEAAGEARVTIAGGVRHADDIARLHELGADAQVGMALYTGAMHLGDAITAAVRSDRPDGLWPTIVSDEYGIALGLAYSSPESVREAVRTRRGVYCSRERGLWRKGDTSGHSQDLLRVEVDCDRDALRFTVRQRGTFCHTGTRTCWGPGRGLAALERRIGDRIAAISPYGSSGSVWAGTQTIGHADAQPLAPPRDQRSYTARLSADPGLLGAKLREEADELARARTSEEVRHEAADLLYFTLVAAARAGVTLAEIGSELDRRARALTRRPGNAKEVT